MENERILNFITQDQWENQEQDGRTSSVGKHHRSKEQDNGGDKYKTKKN
jgi:hypothetical protein